MSMDMVLLLLCLWACVATGTAWHFYTRWVVGRLLIIGLSKDIVMIARGELTLEITDTEVKRTYKEKQHA